MRIRRHVWTVARARAGLLHREPLLAQRALLGRPGDRVERRQGDARHPQIDAPAAAVDDRSPRPKPGLRHARSSSMTSRVLPPVVTTSSTTTAVSPGSTEKPRRRVILPGRVPLGEQEAGAHGPSHFMADDQAAQRRRDHYLAFRHTLAASSRPKRSASAGCCRTRAHWRYSLECRPLVRRKWPFR